MRYIFSIVLLLLTTLAFSQGAGIQYMDTIPTHHPDASLRHSTLVRDLTNDQLYNYEDSIWKRVPNETEIVYAIDSVQQLASMDSFVNFKLGDRIINRSTGANYVIQADSVAGYANDTVAVIPVDTTYAVLQPINGQYAAEWFGAVGDGVADDADAFENGFTYMAKSKVTTLNLESDKTYLFTRDAYFDTIETNVTLKGNGAKLTSSENTAFYFDNAFIVKTMSGNHGRGDSILTVTEALTDVSVGDLVHIFSNTDVETGFNYDENDVSKVTAVSGSVVTLSKPLNFSYQPGGETVTVNFFKPRTVRIENLILNETSIKGERISVHIDNIKAYNESPSASFDFFSFNKGYGATFKNVEFSGFRYGILLNRYSNVEINNISGENGTHPVSVGTFCDGVIVDNFKYYNCTTDAHPSFNITYRNGEVWSENINIRALGVTVQNVTVHPDTSTVENSTGSPIGIQSLAAEYRFLLSEYDTYIDNLVFIDKLDVADPRGLAINEVAKAKIINSKLGFVYFGQLSTTPDSVHLQISDSEIGGFRTYKYNSVNIYNTRFDANLNIIPLPYIYEGTTFGGSSTFFMNIYSSSFEGVVGDTTSFVNEWRNNDNFKFYNTSFKNIERFEQTLVHSTGYGDNDVISSQLITVDTFPSYFYANEGHSFLNSVIRDSLFIMDNDSSGLTIENDTLKVGDGTGDIGILFDFIDTETAGLTWQDNTARWWRIYNGDNVSRNLILETSSDDTEIEFAINGVTSLVVDKSGTSGLVSIGADGAANTTFVMETASAGTEFQISSLSTGTYFNSHNNFYFRETPGNDITFRVETDGDVFFHDNAGAQGAKWNAAQSELYINSVTDQGAYNLQVEGDAYLDDQLIATDHKQYGNEASSTDGSGDITVTFGTAFSVAPAVVIITSNDATPYIHTVTAKTTTTFTVRIYDTGGSAVTSTAMDFDWLAIR